MDMAITIGIVFLVVGLPIAVVAFEVKRHGWKPVLQYLLFAVLGRILIYFTASNMGQVKSSLIALLGAGALVWLWPHIVEQRKREEELDEDIPGENEIEERR